MTRIFLAVAATALYLLAAPSAQADITNVRTGIHPSYVRVAFDSDAAQSPNFTIDDRTLSITFDQSLSDTAEALPDIIAVYIPFISEWALTANDGKTVFTATLAQSVAPKLTRGETLSYLDLTLPQIAAAPDLTGVAPDVAAIRTATKAMNKADREANEKAKRDALLAAEKAKAEEEAEQQKAAAQAAEAEAAEATLSGQAKRSRLTSLDVMVQNRPFESRLTYLWDVTVPAAIFQRAGSLWVVFENDVEINHPAGVFTPNARITGVDRLPHSFGTVLRYSLAPDQNVIAQRENTRWEIEIKDSITRPRDPIVMTRQTDPTDGKRVFFALGEAGSRFVFDDTLVGDQLIVVPSTLDGKGLAAPHRAAGFEALQTAQGVAFAQLGDGVDVRRYRNGAAIYSTRGLALSDTGAELASASGQRAVRLIDLAGWAGDPNVPEAERAHELLYAISMAPQVNLNNRRAAYARFLIGRGFALDAIGVIEIILKSDPSMAKNPTLLAMRGVARLMARRFEGAYQDLMSPALDTEPDAYLWRAVAAEETRRYSEALSYFERGADVLSLYDDKDQARFQLTAVRAAKALGRTDVAETELRRLEALDAPSPYKEWGSYLRAMTHLNNGDRETSKRILGVLSADAPRAIEARARFSLTKLALEDAEITADDAIDTLEKLRFAWRGGPFELDLLEELSELYWNEKNYRDALGVLRQAVTYFPIGERTRGLTRTMEERFEALFLDGIADNMDAVSAVALYYDFRELTPLGASGDKMVRRLADRLVNVELFDRAAQLLEHQVAYRLEGVAQASVAARLAMVHLLNDSPSDALRVLRSTRASNIPKDLRAERFRIEARALIDTKRYQEAVVALEADKTQQADMLRADASWGGKDWPLVRKTARKLLADAGDVLSDDDRRHVLRWAIAATLDNVPSELGEIRKTFGPRMRSGLYAEAFEAIAGSTSGDSMEMPRLSGNLADVDTLEAFMESYRAAFRPNAASTEDEAAL